MSEGDNVWLPLFFVMGEGESGGSILTGNLLQERGNEIQRNRQKGDKKIYQLGIS